MLTYQRLWLQALTLLLLPLVAPVAQEIPQNIQYNPRWHTQTGETQQLSDFSGNWVILNLWATWCRPCLTEMPSLDKLHRRYQAAGLVVLPIVRDDTGQSTWREMQKFFHQTRIKHLPLLKTISDEDLTGLPYTHLPTTYIFNPSGNLISTHQGAEDWFSDEKRTYIETLLTQTNQTPFQAPTQMILDIKP